MTIYTNLLCTLFLSGKIIDLHPGTKEGGGIIQSGIFIIIISMGIFTSISRNIVSSIFHKIKSQK